ncbi:GGDEF domain-containing protein [Sphingomonas sp. Leaf4]|uniref:GGDEF domain-containing protein n=1 Tax=Sphingomonas sp. Leaf4 TaxID=2876553 RepID=UPI001E5EDD50|nr:GGDEF domain-containing protein [Sphingomonas sp. Leaf4]
MDGAIYALIGNMCVAALFAVAFATIRLSYSGQREVMWFFAVYAIGMLTPLSELGVRLTQWTGTFTATSYASFLLCIVLMPLGFAALGGLRKPWAAAGAILLLGVVIRAGIWGGPRNTLWYELCFQAPFATASALSAVVAQRMARTGGGRLWWGLTFVSGLLGIHFLVKPFFAAAYGSGATARDYAASAYALFSQATGGILIVTAGLMVLLLVMQKVMGHTIAESETDPLTGLANRRGLERRAARLFDPAARSPVAAIVFDLDHFKRINDGYGHATGDAVLRAFAHVLRTALPPDALVARLGGEEFVALLDRTTLRGAWLSAQAVRGAMPAMGAHLPAVTVSAGLAERESGDTLERLLERADGWTYAAKRAGRNRVCPMPEPVGATPPFTASA